MTYPVNEATQLSNSAWEEGEGDWQRTHGWRLLTLAQGPCLTCPFPWPQGGTSFLGRASSMGHAGHRSTSNMGGGGGGRSFVFGTVDHSNHSAHPTESQGPAHGHGAKEGSAGAGGRKGSGGSRPALPSSFTGVRSLVAGAGASVAGSGSGAGSGVGGAARSGALLSLLQQPGGEGGAPQPSLAKALQGLGPAPRPRA